MATLELIRTWAEESGRRSAAAQRDEEALEREQAAAVAEFLQELYDYVEQERRREACTPV